MGVGDDLSLPLTGTRSEANHQELRLQGQDERKRWHGVKETNGVHNGKSREIKKQVVKYTDLIKGYCSFERTLH